MIRAFIHPFFNAWVFLTRLPCPAWVEHTPQYQRRAACHAPLVGLIIGGLTGLVVLATAPILPLTVVVALSMVTSVLLTGALHEDGLGDVCDGFGGGHNATQIVNIMKDSRIGSFGAIGLILVLLLKYVTLVEIARSLPAPWPPLLLWILMAGHALSRFSAVSLMVNAGYAGSQQTSKSGPIATPMQRPDLLYAITCALLPVMGLLFLQPLVAIALPLVWLIRHILRRMFLRRLNGYTGDCLGAVQQLSEVTFYLGICAAFMR